jgi:dipeptide transport system ATP-binding protein
MTAAAILEARDLARQYRIGRGLFSRPGILRAVDGVSLSLHPGRTLAAVGESGCGKSTLGRLLTMIEPPDEGEILIDGRAVATTDRARLGSLRQDVQIVFQDPYG